MSSWSRSSYRASGRGSDECTNDRMAEIREDQSNGWQTVGAPRTWSTAPESSSSSRWGSSAGGSRVWGNSSAQGDMPSAFSKKPRDDRPPRRITDEEARRDYVMKLAAEKARTEAEQAKQIADTEDNFPSLGSRSAPKRSGAAAVPPAPKKSWSSHIISANDENEQKRLADEKVAKEATEKLAEGMTILRLGRQDMRQPFFTTGEIETVTDFDRNERLRRACFSSSIMEEQEKYDYNRDISYREDDLGDEPARAYSPHSPKYPHTFDDEEAAEEE